MHSSKEKTNQKSKKDEKSPTKIDYIIKSGKPLIFKKKKIKKVSDLIGKGNFYKKEEEDFSWENEDLSEKFFERYFSYSQLEPEKSKIKNSNRELSNVLLKSSHSKKLSLEKNMPENDNLK